MFIICLLGLLTACGEQTAATGWSEAQMAKAVWDTQGAEEFYLLRYGEEDFSLYVSDVYRIDPADLAGGAVLYAGGISAREIAVLRLADANGTSGAASALKLYIDDRAGAFAGYAPEQYGIVEGSGTASRGTYVALLICPDQRAAQDAFAACFASDPPDGEPVGSPVQAAAPAAAPAEDDAAPADSHPEDDAVPAEPRPEDVPPAPEPDVPRDDPGIPAPKPEPEPEEAPWSYDRERLVAAWQSGDRSGLPEEDLAILEICDQIPALTDDSLTDYQRELALHDWMLDWAEYDPGALSSGPQGSPMPHNDNPYGFFTGRKGICLGYAATFQLLMDFSGIPCIIVSGTSHQGTSDHAWNIVELDGERYCVDVTWDDPVAYGALPASITHLYFNVTSEFLRLTDHQWDESAVPEAEGTALAWIS